MVNTVTLNPGIDKIQYFGQFRKGITNRIRDTRITVGGKGTHVSMNLSVMGMRSRAYGLAYGQTGRYILDTLGEWGVDTHFAYRADAQSRTNCLLVEDDGTSTLICEKGDEPTPEDTRRLLEEIERNIRPGDALVLSGDTSNFPDPHIYGRIIDMLADRRLKVYVDASGDALVQTLSKRPFLIKPNEDELAALCAKPMDDEAAVVAEAVALSERYAIPVVAVSLGGRGSIVSMEGAVYRVTPPKIDVANTIGCGDCYLAGLIFGFETGMGAQDILRHATAASAAAAESRLSVGFDARRAGELMPMVGIERIAGGR